MEWLEMTVMTTTAGAEAVSEALHRAGCSGTLVMDPHDVEQLRRERGDWDYIDAALLDPGPGQARVTGYVPADPGGREALAAVEADLAALRAMGPGFDAGSCTLTVKTVRDEDWAMNWREHYRPFPAGQRLYVQPEWIDEPAPGGRLAVRIDPGMAFGTGTHETTFLCLELLEGAARPGCRVADVGCGTGILGIAAAGLGAGRVLAVDRDPVAVTAAGRNRELNAGAGLMEVRQGDLLGGVDETFDVIVANIIADVIMPFAPAALERLEPGGVFIASGILRDRAAEVAGALETAGFTVEQVREKGEWAALMARRR